MANMDSKLNVACAHCLATNRVPAQRLEEGPVCGRCKQELLDGRPVELTDANFDLFTQRTELPVLVDFWAPWCGPCVGMAPQFDLAARQLKGRAVLVKVNSDDNPKTSARFGIRSIPTLVRLDSGREKSRRTGALQAAQIVSLVG